MNTLLEKMGFSDPDRKDPMHDAACGYLAERAAQLVALFVDASALERAAENAVDALLIAQANGTHQVRATWQSLTSEELAESAVEAWQSALNPVVFHEVHVEKGDRYRATIGFIDLRVQYRGTHGPSVYVEVKWSEYSVSDAIRQIAVYRDNGHGGNWVLAAPHALNLEQKAALDSQSITYVQLDRSKVEAFAKARRAAKADSPVF